MKKILLGLLLWMSVPASSWAVMITLSPSTTDIYVGDVFSVDIIADIGATEPLLGWGLDIGNTSGLLAETASPVIGSAWFPTVGMDGDGLAGLAFPFPVFGSDVLLASLSFQATGVGIADLIPSITLGDLTEGFALSSSGFADVTFTNLTLNIMERPVIIPEPATVLLMLTALAGMRLTAKRRLVCKPHR